MRSLARFAVGHPWWVVGGGLAAIVLAQATLAAFVWFARLGEAKPRVDTAAVRRPPWS